MTDETIRKLETDIEAPVFQPKTPTVDPKLVRTPVVKPTGFEDPLVATDKTGFDDPIIATDKAGFDDPIIATEK